MTEQRLGCEKQLLSLFLCLSCTGTTGSHRRPRLVAPGSAEEEENLQDDPERTTFCVHEGVYIYLYGR